MFLRSFGYKFSTPLCMRPLAIVFGIRLSHSRLSHSRRELPTIPAMKEPLTSHTDFLKAIGRKCVGFSEKYRDWDHLFLSRSQDMRKLMGITTSQRKYILSWLEQYKVGRMPYEIKQKPRKKRVPRSQTWKERMAKGLKQR